MKIPFYLKVNSNGTVGVTKNAPALQWNEVSIFMNLNIPDKIFDKPTLQANITIPEEAVIKTPIEASVVDNVAEAIEQATGLKFNITVEKTEEEEQ
ncbi:MAG: hypothetical protein WA019_03525 [Candidatus Moraniibacteriota bacterium]